MLKQLYRTHGKRLWQIVVGLGIIIPVYLYFRDYVDAAYALWQTATYDQKVGSVLFIVCAVIIIAILYALIEDAIVYLFLGARIGLSTHKGAIRIRKHMQDCVRDAQPKQRKDRRLWRSLVTSFVDAYADGYTTLHDRGISSQQLLSSNFQIYAKCVASLLSSAQG